MNPADKAALRLAIGLGLAVLIAYGFDLQLPFAVCVMAVIVLTAPGPAIPLVKGMVLAVIVAAVMAAGMLLVPILEHYALAGVLLIGVLLFKVFGRPASAMTMISVITITLIPVIGVLEQALAAAIIGSLVVGIVTGVVVKIASHALFPDAPSKAGAAPTPATPSPETANWMAVRATLVVMPVFVVALSNPSQYIPMVMKTVALAQQANAVTARSAGKLIVGSTLLGACLAALVWLGLSLRPNLWMLMLWSMAAALWAGAKLFGASATSLPPAFWSDALVNMLILLGPAIEDSANGKDVYQASAIRVGLFVVVALYAWATLWVLERWRASRSRSLFPERR
jgi:hypothetical protein